MQSRYLGFLILASSLLGLGLFASQGLDSPAKTVAQTASPVPSPKTPDFEKLRDVFYFSDRFGFRFVYPRDYAIETSSPPKSDSRLVPLEVIEIWQQRDFLLRDSLPEKPPTIRISIYKNVPQRPLTDWKGELSRQDDRTLEVAGQPAIAYSSTGLYETDNILLRSPDNKYVLRFQAGYLKPNDALRQTLRSLLSSFSFDLLSQPHPTNQSRINYTRLQTLLNQRNWLAADVENRAILQRLRNLDTKPGDLLYSSQDVIRRLPCNDLRILDRLWSQASQGRFGYRAQVQQWQKTRGLVSSVIPKRRTERWGQQVGWWRSTTLPNQNPVGLEVSGTPWKLDFELTPTLQAPSGHFPWGGVSSSLLTSLISERSMGCGSCTVDAMNLSNERFYNYIPAMMNRLNQCQLK